MEATGSNPVSPTILLRLTALVPVSRAFGSSPSKPVDDRFVTQTADWIVDLFGPYIVPACSPAAFPGGAQMWRVTFGLVIGIALGAVGAYFYLVDGTERGVASDAAVGSQSSAAPSAVNRPSATQRPLFLKHWLTT